MNTKIQSHSAAQSNVPPALPGEMDMFSPNGFLYHAINHSVSLAC